MQLIDQYHIFKEVPLQDVLHICTTLTGPRVTLKHVFGNNSEMKCYSFPFEPAECLRCALFSSECSASQ